MRYYRVDPEGETPIVAVELAKVCPSQLAEMKDGRPFRYIPNPLGPNYFETWREAEAHYTAQTLREAEQAMLASNRAFNKVIEAAQWLQANRPSDATPGDSST